MPQSLVSVTDIAHSTVALYRTHFLEFLRVLVWLIVPVSLEALVPLFPISTSSRDILRYSLNGIAAIVSLFISIVLIDMIVGYLRKMPNKKVLQSGWGVLGRMVDFVVVSVLQGLVVGVWFIPFLALPFILVGFEDLAGALQFSAIAILVGLVLAIPGFVFWIWFSFARYSVLIDAHPPGSGALTHSKSLARGRFWSIAWRWIGSYLTIGIPIFLVTVIILAALGALMGNPNLAFGSGRSTLWWSALIVNLVSTLVTPLFVTIGVTLYEDAKRAR
ncbi:hypothetical protein HY478_00910 [Candidatus Uhrbacteria bacterium]|nr:hypothetical protein [Candidatus Uhrbacteria bacterium]